ncbi:MAG: acyltransferase family protein [Solobacterium sp.]|jgi:serine/alanine racemase|nr:acyltransferase family protein [Solobacterium sp.]MCH4222315.1 acyltransferase family protein [Solobacterium sp.]MCH4265644.1 acyltransferase family protein [Solobacterium sp.]
MKRLNGIDGYRILAVLMVISIHISPLYGISSEADFILTRVLGRTAVPFFFTVTGYFVLSSDDDMRIQNWQKRTLLLYLGAVLLYLPLSIYNGTLSSLSLFSLFSLLCFDGTMYHLWYFPAVLI